MLELAYSKKIVWDVLGTNSFEKYHENNGYRYWKNNRYNIITQLFQEDNLKHNFKIKIYVPDTYNNDRDRDDIDIYCNCGQRMAITKALESHTTGKYYCPSCGIQFFFSIYIKGSK